MRRLVVFGATSAIAQAALRCFANDGDEFLLVGRDRKRLECIQGDLAARGAGRVELLAADPADISGQGEIFVQLREKLPDYNHVLVAYGYLGDQRAAAADYQKAAEILSINFLSVVSLLTVIANEFEQRRVGHITVISSVAGDRGRQSNYIYGAAKGGLSTFLEGLRNRLDQVGVGVLTVKPGFVDTPMTAGLKQGLLFASAERVGQGLYRAVCAGRHEVYLPWFWLPIMLVVRHIPEFIFKRLRF